MSNSKRSVYKQIQNSAKNNKKLIGILIDPDKSKVKKLKNTIKLSIENKVNFFLVGGSLISSDVLKTTIQEIKRNSEIPIILFPGGVNQVSKHADAIFLLSLISGRNPDLLIGKHVEVANYLRKSKLEIIPTGYILIDGGNRSSVQYMSNTNPIPKDKIDIAVSTALAGTQLGLKTIYLDAGSGASKNVNSKLIKAIADNIKAPLVVGGGISKSKTLDKVFRAGADMVVLGTIIEKSPEKIIKFCEVRDRINANTR